MNIARFPRTSSPCGWEECVTNWDAQALAKMVHRGIKVELIN